MNQPSDTPPNGDFARYIEQLMKANAAKVALGAREDLLHPPTKVLASSLKSRAVPTPSPSPSLSSSAVTKARPPPVSAFPSPFSLKGFASPLRWMVLAWIGLQLLGMVVPGAGMLFIPLLLAYIAWLIFGLKRYSSTELKVLLQAWAKKLSEQTKKP